MIVIHATLTDAVKRTHTLDGLLETFRERLAEASQKEPEEIVISAGFVEYMTKPFGAMLLIEFLNRSMLLSEANDISRDAAQILQNMLSTNLTQRHVLVYPTIHDTLPPVFAP